MGREMQIQAASIAGLRKAQFAGEMSHGRAEMLREVNTLRGKHFWGVVIVLLRSLLQKSIWIAFVCLFFGGLNCLGKTAQF